MALMQKGNKSNLEILTRVRKTLLSLENGAIPNPSELKDLLSNFEEEITKNEELEKKYFIAKKNEESFFQVFDNSTDGIVIYDINKLKVLQANKTYVKMLGYTKEEISKLTLYDIVAHDKESIDEFVSRILTEGFVKIGKRLHRKKDGTLITVEITADLLAIRNTKAILVNIRDVSYSENKLTSNKVIEERYKNVVTNIRQAYYEADKKGRFTFCNQAFYILSGLKQNELIGKNSFLLARKDFRRKIYLLYAKAIKDQRSSLKTELIIEIKNGKPLWVEVSTNFEYGKNGQLIRGLNIVKDITERKKTEIRNEETEKKYLNIFNSVVEGIIYIDQQGTIKAVNKEMSNLTGISAEDLIGKSSFFLAKKYLTGSNLKESLVILKNSLSGNEITDFNFTINNKILSVKTPKHKANEGFTAIFSDVTKTLESQKKIIESERSYRELFNYVSEAIYILNENGVFIDVNDGAVRMYQQSRDYLIGKTPADVSAPGKNDLQKVVEYLQIAFKGKPQKFEFWGIRKNGEIFPKIVSLNKGKYFGKDVIIAVAIDVSESKRIKEKLSQNELRLLRAETLAKVGNWELHLESNEIIGSEGAKGIYELNGNTFRPSYIQNLHLHKYRKKLDESLNELIYNGKPYNEKFKIRTAKTDTIKTVHSVAVFDKAKNIVFGTIADISEQENSHQELLESENRFRQIFKNNTLVSFLLESKTGKIVDTNQASADFYGWSVDELKQMKISDINTLPEKDVLTFLKKAKNLKQVHFEFKHKLKSGEIRDVEVFSSTIKYSNKTLIHSVVHDVTEKSEALRLLKESEHFNKVLFHDSQIPLVVIETKNYTFVDINNTAVNIYGYKNRETLIGKTPAFVSTPTQYNGEDSYNLAIEKIKIALKKGSHRFEWRHQNPDGKIWDAEVLLMKFVVEEIEFLQFSLIDITERKKSQLELRQSEKNYRQLTELSPDAIIVHTEGKFVFVNKAALKIIGASNREQLLGKPVLSIMHPESIPLAAERMKKMMKTGKAVEPAIEKLIRLDGKIIITEIVASPLIFNGKPSIITVARDITENTQILEKLRKNEKLFRSISNLTTDYLFYTEVLDDGTSILNWVSDNFQKITGYTFEEYKKIGGWQSTLHKDDIIFDQEAFKKLQKNKPVMTELRAFKKTGEIQWLQSYGSPIWDDEKNKLVAVVGAVKDITEKKKILKEIIEAKEKAEASEKIKTEFLAQMSHEIRSPLNVILSFMSIIEEEMESNDNEDIQLAFSSIDSASRRIIRTIDLILNMSDLQLGTYEVIKKNFDYTKFLKQIEMEYQQSAAMRKLDLTLSIKSEKTKLYSDDYAFMHIIINLVDNAIKYTKVGSVLIEAKENSKNNLVIQIKDTGIGISEEFLPKLFTSFSQEEQGYKRSYDGNGLGMALVKRYCDLLGATISVKSKKGKGTTFKIVFPNKKA